MEEFDLNHRKDMLTSYYQEVVRYLGKFGLNRDDLKDAIHETYAIAFKNVIDLRDETKAKNWLMKIARSVGLKYKRNYENITIIECSFEEDMVQLDNETTYENDILEKIIMEADMELLRQCLRKLSEKERRVLSLQYEYDEKLQDIAIMIGENLNNTKSIARRAKLKLKDLLIDGGYEHGK